MRGRSRRLGGDLLVRRAARSVALQATALVALAMLVLVVLVSAVVVHQQSADSEQLLHTTLATADDVGDPPPGAWLVLVRGGRTQHTAGLPDGLADQLGRLREAASRHVREGDVTGEGGRRYRVATQVRRAGTAQVVLDLSSQRRQEAELLQAVGVATLVALVFAAVTGVLLGRRAVRPLADALALQRAFVADASHELRTPLTLLSTRAQVLDQAVEASSLDDRSREDSRGVVRDVARLVGVVDDLLVAADPASREQHDPTDLTAIVAAVLDSAAAHAGAAGVELAGDLGGRPARVLGSAAALRRAVLSLVENAIDHTPAGGRVDVSVRASSTAVTVRVADTGPGISPRAGRDVFARFASGGARAGRAHYGLGLALSNDVANRHGGQLRLVASPVGATFELVLPARRAGGRPRKLQDAGGRVVGRPPRREKTIDEQQSRHPDHLADPG